MIFPHFTQALNDLGKNDQERAQALGVPQRTLTRYKAGDLPRTLLILARHPRLLSALAEDLTTTTEEPEPIHTGPTGQLPRN
jgi:hypothetical protein